MFVDTVNKFTSYVDNESDPDFSRTIYGAKLKVEIALFYASPRSPSVHHAMGGPKIDGSAHVISTEGEIMNSCFETPNKYCCEDVGLRNVRTGFRQQELKGTSAAYCVLFGH